MTKSIIPESARKRVQKRRLPKQLSLIVFTLISIGLIAYAAYYYFIPKEETFVLDFYTYAEVGTEDFIETLSAKGAIIPRRVDQIASKIGGVVEEVYIKEGDDIKSGTPLLRIYSQEVVADKNGAETELGEAKAKLAQLKMDQELERSNEKVKIIDAEEQLKQAKENLELQKVLYGYGSIARIELERAEQSLETAKRRLEQSQRELELLSRRQEADQAALEKTISISQERLEKALEKMENFVVKAPFDGRILSLKIPGNGIISAHESLGEIADLTDQIVELQVTPGQTERFDVGTSVKINVGQVEYKGEVSYIAPQAKQGQEGSTVLVRVDFLEEVAHLRPNSAVNANIHLRTYEDSLFLPRGAYLTSGQQLFVYVIDGNIATQREVQFGLLQGNSVQILRGLELGENVIISSYDAYRSRKQIEILPEGGHKQ